MLRWFVYVGGAVLLVGSIMHGISWINYNETLFVSSFMVMAGGVAIPVLGLVFAGLGLLLRGMSESARARAEARPAPVKRSIGLPADGEAGPGMPVDVPKIVERPLTLSAAPGYGPAVVTVGAGYGEDLLLIRRGLPLAGKLFMVAMGILLLFPQVRLLGAEMSGLAMLQMAGESAWESVNKKPDIGAQPNPFLPSGQGQVDGRTLLQRVAGVVVPISVLALLPAMILAIVGALKRLSPMASWSGFVAAGCVAILLVAMFVLTASAEDRNVGRLSRAAMGFSEWFLVVWVLLGLGSLEAKRKAR